MIAMSGPPIALKRPFVIESEHGSRVDDYYWLRDDTRTHPEVLTHLEAENAYTAAVLKSCGAQQENLYGEIIARIPQDDSTVPGLSRGDWYWRHFASGQQYPVYLRRADRAEAPEEKLLDCNALAEGHDFFELGGYEVSHDNSLLAYAEDLTGRRQYRMRFKNLLT